MPQKNISAVSLLKLIPIKLMSDSDVFVDIGKIHNHIKKLPKESLIHKILKR